MREPYKPKAFNPEHQADQDAYYQALGVETEILRDADGYTLKWFQHGKPITGPLSIDHEKKRITG